MQNMEFLCEKNAEWSVKCRAENCRMSTEHKEYKPDNTRNTNLQCFCKTDIRRIFVNILLVCSISILSAELETELVNVNIKLMKVR